MSTFVERRYDCTRCGHTEPHTVAVSINGELRPDLRSAILDGTFQVYACSRCGATYKVEDAFVYLDFARKEWITCFPASREGAWPQLEGEPYEDWRQAMVVHAAPVARSMAEGFRIGAVFGLDALREKLVAWAAGLDDGWLEVFKFELLRTTDLGFSPGARVRLVVTEPDRLVFAGPKGVFGVARTAWEELRGDPLAWVEALEAVARGPYVDVGRVFLSPRA